MIFPNGTRRLDVAIVAVLATLIACAWWADDAYGAKTRCESVTCLHRALAWQQHDRARLERDLERRTRRDATYAVRLAAAAFHIPERKLRCIAIRESGLGRQRTPEPSSGASGEMQFLAGTWASTPFAHAGFSVWDNVANVLAAAQIIAHDGSARQWATGRQCGL